MKPIITTNGKLTQLRYELPHRVHCAKIYPVKAPNGSTIIIYGNETGVGVIWRGGRPLKTEEAPTPKPPKKPTRVNGNYSDVVMIIDSDDEASAKAASTHTPPEAEFESDEEELDPDQPYPSVIQQVRLSLNASVLHIAIPQIPAISNLRSADSIPAIFSKKIVFTVACADYSIRVITVPLSPPTQSTKETPSNLKTPFGEEVLKIPTHAGHQSTPRGVDITWTSRDEPTFNEDEESDDEMEIEEPEDGAATSRASRAKRRQGRSQSGPPKASNDWDLLVASHSTDAGGLLKIFRFHLSDTSVSGKSPISSYQTVNLRTPATRIAFNSAQYPKRRHSQVLITDSSGIARIYDPFAPCTRKRRTEGDSEVGNFVGLFRTNFEQPQSHTISPPLLVTRKPILDAAWASDGHGIFALLADGEWGIWDVNRSGPNPPRDPATFSARGYVGGSDVSQNGSDPTSPKVKGGRNSLAPMTPNTRRTRQESLFQGTGSTSSIPTRGAISVASLASSDGDDAEDSVLIQYGADLYRITNLGQLWARSESGNKGGLSRVQGVRLLGEAITSVAQFETTTKEARSGIPRDALISTEHRLIITTTTQQPLSRDLNVGFGVEQGDEKEIRETDQALLARGELDLGGMDRLLEDMEGSGSRSLLLGNPRKVLFASSTN